MKLTCAMMALMLSLMLQSCASICGTRESEVRIRTMPRNAEIFITNKYGDCVFDGISPCVAYLEKGDGFFRRARYEVEAYKEGYHPAKQPIEPAFWGSGWYYGNAIFGGLIGIFIVDPATGAMHKFKKNQPVIHLEPK